MIHYNMSLEILKIIVIKLVILSKYKIGGNFPALWTVFKNILIAGFYSYKVHSFIHSNHLKAYTY